MTAQEFQIISSLWTNRNDEQLRMFLAKLERSELIQACLSLTELIRFAKQNPSLLGVDHFKKIAA